MGEDEDFEFPGGWVKADMKDEETTESNLSNIQTKRLMYMMVLKSSEISMVRFTGLFYAFNY